MDSFTLGPTPKIDFTQAVEHTPATAWKLANLSSFTGNLKLLRFGLWLARVWKEVSLLRTVFCDIILQTTHFYLYQAYVETAWPSVRTVFAKILSAFERNSEIFWNTGHRPDVLPCRSNGLQRLPKQCRLLKLNSLLNIDWPSVQTVLL
jgi:hypothetical protein